MHLASRFVAYGAAFSAVLALPGRPGDLFAFALAGVDPPDRLSVLVVVGVRCAAVVAGDSVATVGDVAGSLG